MSMDAGLCDGGGAGGDVGGWLDVAVVGTTIKVLVDAVNAKKKTAVGRHGGQAPEIDGHVLLSKCPASLAPGELVNVKIADFNYYDLLAVPVLGAAERERTHGKAGEVSRPAVRLSLPVMSSVESRSKRR